MRLQPAPPKIYNKVAPATQETALSFLSSTRTLMAWEKKEKIFEKKRLTMLLIFFIAHYVLGQYKVPLHALDHSVMVTLY